MEHPLASAPVGSRWAKAAGFSATEVMITAAVVGLLAAIGAPNLGGWMNTRRLDVAQGEVYSALRLAQRTAMQRRESWQFSLREGSTGLEWAIHSRSVSPHQVQGWQALGAALELDSEDTTLLQRQGVYYVYFKHHGDVSHLRTITFQGRQGYRARRCVILSTLIGAMRKGRDQPIPKGGRSCY